METIFLNNRAAKSALCVMMIFSSAEALAVTNLVVNGDFELYSSGNLSAGYLTVAAGSTVIDGWTVQGASVDLIQGNYGAISGVSIDLAGSPGPGSIFQDILVEANKTYRLSWDYFRNGVGTPLTVEFGTNSAAIYSTSNLTSPTTGQLSFSSTTAGFATVKFSSGAGSFGPTIDNIIVTTVPNPSSLALFALGLVGLIWRKSSIPA